MKKLISFIIRADKGFFKKPDINEGIYLTYNLIHKPAILGILGAIIGLKGFEKHSDFPEYYKKLKNIPVGVRPVGDVKGVFQKTIITYTNTTGLATDEKGGNLIVSEQTLIKPSFELFLLLDLNNREQEKLYNYIKKQKAEFLPYMGKNDYSIWWDKKEVAEYDPEPIHSDKPVKISTIFLKDEPVIKYVAEAIGRKALFEQKEWFCVFERLPLKYDENLRQYELATFAYTNATLNPDIKVDAKGQLYKLKGKEELIFLY